MGEPGTAGGREADGAGESVERPGVWLTSTPNIAAFNLGNAAGAWLGGVAIDAGFGYTAPNWVGAALAFAGLGVALVSGLSGLSGRARRSRPAVTV
ncbi:hypothetical protein [Saccharothrix sp. ALI-22-I]|uniref:hypothetical protein n=1 Tax=Saccharothrix sp. ALI-22-I TaxID=1933778 RepID=UPI0023791966|nr:hypothetical protein [Saccharothrix sp. ALI-22-I]